MWDATAGVGMFLDILVNGIGTIFSMLERIQLGDTNLLTISITMFLISAIIPILFTILSVRASHNISRQTSEANARKNAEKERYYKPKHNNEDSNN